ncbi:MAG: phosphatidate cytidylyltransferase [Planctomycetaceae bacterium]|nr:phosphatidate cytidylyltransferase [Planctomycetaceae bacterium]
MLGWRFAVSAVVIPALLLLFRWDAHSGFAAPVLLVFCLGLSLRSAWEAVELLKCRNMRPRFEAAAVCCAAVILSAWGHCRIVPVPEQKSVALLVSLGCIGAAFVFSFLLLLTLEAVRFREAGAAAEALGTNMLCVLYAGGLPAVLAQMRWFPSAEYPYYVIGSVIIAVKGGDVMAYTFGRLWGNRKMIPRLSPGKTWMGGLGAVVGSSLGAWLWLTFGGRLFAAQPHAGELRNVLAYGAVLGIAGLVGDLCESLLKRDVGKKDSAALMPGFGGLLDLLDSPLFAGPLALAWWILSPPGG